MALFDSLLDSEIVSTVTEGKECKDEKECKECEDKEEKKEDKAAEAEEEKVEDKADEEEAEDEDEEEELDEDDAKEAKESATFDVEEAASFEDMRGGRLALATMVEESHSACLEFIGTTIALDKVDVKCTESLVKASTDAEKAIVTEQFKESVKVYFQKFKAFIQKVMNNISRAVSRVGAWFKNFIANIRNKIAQKRISALDEAKCKETEIEVAKGLVDSDYDGKIKGLEAYIDRTCQDLLKIAQDNNTRYGAEEVQAKIRSYSSENTGITAENLEKELFGENVKVKVSELGSNILNDLKNVNMKNGKATATKVVAFIKAIEKTVTTAKDIDSKAMAGKVAMVNISVKYLNRFYSLLVKYMSRWVGVRLKAVSMCKATAAKESASMSLLEQFEAMC